MFYDNSKELDRIDELERQVKYLGDGLADEVEHRLNERQELQAALDAERARVKVDKEVYFGKIADLQTQVAQLTAQLDVAHATQDELWTRNGYLQANLTQLQQLVGEIQAIIGEPPKSEHTHKIGEIQRVLTRATLPASATEEATKAQVFNEWGEALQQMADGAKPKEQP